MGELSFSFIMQAMGSKGSDGALHFLAGPTDQWFNTEKTLVDPACAHYDLIQNVDVIFIFDSCYSYLATRSAAAPPRIVEVLAAVDANDPLANSPGERMSFARLLTDEIATRKRKGEKSVQFAELIASLRRASPVKKPTHGLKMGSACIRLEFSGLATRHSLPAPPDYYAAFHVHLSQSMPKDQFQAFVDWIGQLSPSIGLTLQGVYETNSMCLIFESSYDLFSKLAGFRGTGFFCESKYRNLLTQAYGPSSMPVMQSTRKDNTSPYKGA